MVINFEGCVFSKWEQKLEILFIGDVLNTCQIYVAFGAWWYRNEVKLME
jgi:hypothetical protein